MSRSSTVHAAPGGTPVIVAVGPDDKFIRVFEARAQGHEQVPEFYRQSVMRNPAQPTPLPRS